MHPYLRAVALISEDAKKGTSRSPLEYDDPLCTISGQEYAEATFEGLHERICDVLRGDRPRVVAQLFAADGKTPLFYEDGLPRDRDR